MKQIVDCHCHIYPEKIAAKAVASIGGFYDLKMENKGTADDLKIAGGKAGITNYVIFSVATKPQQVRSINEFISGIVNESDGKMVGLGAVHPYSEDIKGDIEHIVELGLKGVKLHPDIQEICVDDPACMKIYKLCEKMQLPVLLHCGDSRYDYSNPNRIENLLKAFGKLQVIGAHFGGWSVWEDAVNTLYKYENLTVDCSSSFYALAPEKAAQMVRAYGAGRVLFGTDYPMWKPDEEIKRFMALGLTEEENESILYKNAVKLFQIK